ncbi:hypothetical protein KY321_04735 [Candidatus Woesearchaeota archaeon]|nr:hypothetical protein [Candidatus Woesearchaeota archaeon]
MMKKKGQGVPEAFVDIFAYVAWIFLIMGAIFFLSLDGCTGSKQVKVTDLESGADVAEVDLMLAYLQTTVNTTNCNHENVLKNSSMVEVLDKKLSFNELINLAIMSEPQQNKNIGFNSNLWRKIPKSNFGNPDYEIYVRLLMVCTDQYFVSRFGEPRSGQYGTSFTYDFVLKDDKTILDLNQFKNFYPDKEYVFIDIYSEANPKLKLHISKNLEGTS